MKAILRFLVETGRSLAFAGIFAGSLLSARGSSGRQETLVKEQKITPGVAYRLSFEAAGAGKATEEGRWVVHLRDGEGKLPFDGALEGEWQKLDPKKGLHTHLFYAPEGAATFQLLVRQGGSSFALKNVRLEAVQPEGAFLNGDFAEGEGNYSGWNEFHNARVVEEEGHAVFQIDQNGYVLTDFTPVAGGSRCNIKGKNGAAGFQILAYDSLRHLIGVVERKPGAPFELPREAAYVRLLYATSHEHLPALRVNKVEEAKLVVLESSDQPAVPKVEPCREWEIVLAPGSDPREEHAARELQYWMAAILGKAPPLLAEPSASQAGKIFVGRPFADGFPDDLKGLAGSDGYAVRKKDGAIYIFGAHPRGALYGVHALLERNTDIIWPRPNPEFAAFFSKTARLDFPNADFRSRPVFKSRFVSRGGYSGGNAHLFQDWHERNGLNSPWALHKGNNYLVWQRGAQLGYSGSYTYWLRDVRETDEKVLPVIDGKRDTSRWRQPCYSYPGTAEGIAAGIEKALKSLPGREMEYLHATISDNWMVCACPDCLAPIQLPGGEKLAPHSHDATKDPLFFSTRNFLMLNQVAERLVKDHPGLHIGTHAYIFTAEPPKVEIHPAITPEFAAYPTKNERFPILAGKGMKIGGYDEGIWKRRFEQWGERQHGRLGFFGYYYTDGLNALADTAAEDYRALARFGAVQAHTEGYPVDAEKLSAWDADAIEKWVIARLMWDPSQDPEALRKTFIERVYRGAEKEMTEFYALIRNAWHSAPPNVFVNCHTPASDLFQNLIVTPGIEEKARTLLAKAEGAAQDPRVKKIIQRQRAYFDQLGGTLGRVSIPLVEEATKEWLEPASTHWEKAATVKDFRKVDDWRSFQKAETEHPSSVRIMRDRQTLYLRFEGSDDRLSERVVPSAPAGLVFPNGDRFEARLRGAKNRDYYLAVGPGGHAFSQPPLGDLWKTAVSADGKSWTALVAIPLQALGIDAANPQTIKARLGRVYRGQGEAREESSHNGASLFNSHESLWLDFQIQ